MPKTRAPQARARSCLCPLTLGWCCLCVFTTLFGARGIIAGVAVGLAPAREPLCLGAGGSEGRGLLPASGPPAHLAAAGTVASDCAAMTPSPTVVPMSFAGPGCPSQPGSIAACTLPSGSCPFLRVRQPDQPPGSAGGAAFGLILPLESGGWSVTMCCLWLALEQWDPLASSLTSQAITTASGLPPPTHRIAQPSTMPGPSAPVCSGQPRR